VFEVTCCVDNVVGPVMGLSINSDFVSATVLIIINWQKI